MHEPTHRDRLTGFVHFASELLRAREKPVLRVSDYGLGVFHETELAGLAGIERSVGDAWLSIPRLRRTEAPTLDVSLEGWVVGDLTDPKADPRLIESMPIVVSIEDASELAAKGIIDPSQSRPYYPPRAVPLPPAEDGEIEEEEDQVSDLASPDYLHVVLRPDRIPELVAAFTHWRETVWGAWASAESARRRTIAVYEVLYRLYGIIQSGADAVPEIVFGIGPARLVHEAGIADMPLIEKPCEILLDETTGTLSILPRHLPPVVNLRPFRALGLDAADRAQAPLSARLEARDADPTLPLNPHDPFSFEDILTEAATRLSSRARFVPRADLKDGERLPSPDGDLAVYGTWLVYARPRSTDMRQQDLRRIEDEIRKAEEVHFPKPLVGIVTPPSDAKVVDDDDLTQWGFDTGKAAAVGATSSGSRESGTSSGTQADDTIPRTRSAYFFPLPYNDEQARIIDTLEREDVAVVTGPPGTGKTHTIANVISHFMATGRRVLVTARTAEAIAAVQDKLPESLRSMTIAVVHSDREGAKQLEQAVQALANEASSATIDELKTRISDLQSEIERLDDEITDVDRRLGDVARANLDAITYDGTPHLPMDLALRLADEEVDYDWFEDWPERDAQDPEIVRLVSLVADRRTELGDDLAYLGCAIPSPADLPRTADLLAAVGHEERRRIAAAEDFRGAPRIVLDTSEDEVEARRVHATAAAIEEALSNLGSDLKILYRVIVSEHLEHGSGGPIARLVDSARDLHRARLQISTDPIHIPEGEVDEAKLESAIARLAAGEKPFGFAAALFAQDLKRALGGIRIGVEEPRTTAAWIRVRDYRSWQREARVLFQSWSTTSGLPHLGENADSFFSGLSERIEVLAAIVSVAANAAGLSAPLARLFPVGVDVDTAIRSGSLSQITWALRANLPDAADAPHPALVTLRDIVTRGKGPVFDAMSDLDWAIANGRATEAAIVEARAELTRELTRLSGRVDQLAELDRALKLLAQAGAEEWAKSLADPSRETSDLVPQDWQRAWAWAVARRRIDEVLGLENPATLGARKAELVARRGRAFEALIRQRTLRGLKRHLTDKIKHALSLFTTAMQKLGAGTGQSAQRWRKQIREAALEAAPAAPVWIMPEFRVAEQLPPQLGSFDLVVLDEASQSDVTALGALARGKKWLIVGDEQQVSPSSVGMPQAQIDALRAEYLRHLTIRHAIDQDTSIFDVASMMFPSAHVMLREHFRCVAPIIQFSTRFYNGRLIPLRIPKASERLDPPLIDIFVADGTYNKSKWNPQERDVIVEEIAKIVNDPAMRKRTIAVISLVGSAQADQIERALLADERIGHEAMERHRIVCGDSRTLQGQERDIVFLSMVQAGRSHALTARAYAQRFNVAMSRARDRVYLVRSLPASGLRNDDLKRQVIDHFANPMPAGRKLDGKSILDRCDSGLERDVCQRLLDAGYRVRSQVQAGPYAIDLVVEGADDRRLAIELDGDKWHGPERWDDDMRRQAALERAGWVFWRVFGSQWNTRKDYWWSDLVSTLDRLGIEPIGAAASAEIFTEHRRVQGGRLVAVDGAPFEDDLTAAPPSEVETDEELEDVAAPAAPVSEEDGPAFMRRDPRPAPPLAYPEPEHATTEVAGTTSDETRALYRDDNVVTPGATVKVRWLETDKVMTILLSDRQNAPDQGIVSIHQPLGRALLGAGPDEVVSYTTDGVEHEVLVEDVFPASRIAAE